MKKSLRRAIVALTILISLAFYAFYGRERDIFFADSMGYYVYLPACFIYHDLMHINKLPPGRGISKAARQNLDTKEKEGVHTIKGYTVNAYTYGVAFMECPFFLIAHACELLTGRPANGYSDSYNYLIKCSSIVYTFFGLLLVYKVLRRYYGETVSVFTVCALLLGTNLFWFTLAQSGMAHPPLFFLYALLIWLTIQLHDKPRLVLFFLGGLVSGMITIIRPSDIVCLLIPLLYNVYNRNTLMSKLAFLRENFGGLLLFSAAFVLPVIPQLIYWHLLTGDYIFYSYGVPAFNWRHPHIVEGLFYFKNGWLPYSMVMIFSLGGMFLYKYIRQWMCCLFLIFPLYVYIIYSWYCYNYINGLGSRPMIHLYPLLSICLAAFVQMIATQKKALRLLFSVVCLLFISINICNSMQQQKGVLFSEDSNWLYNFKMLYRMNMSYDDLLRMDTGEAVPDESNIIRQDTVGFESFDDSVSRSYQKDEHKGKGYVYLIPGDEEYPPKALKIVYNKQKFRDAKWLKGSGMFKVMAFAGYYSSHTMVAAIKHNDNFLSWTACRIDNKTGISDFSKPSEDLTIERVKLNVWSYVYFYVKIPPAIQDGDEINLLIWNAGKKEMYIDDLCLELYK